MSTSVSIVGGHGQIARLLTRELVARDVAVRGLVRSEDQFSDLRDDGSTPVLCDVEKADAADLDRALGACDVVIFAAGAGPDSGPDRKKSLDRDGAIKSVEAAARLGARRFVIVSSMGADDPPNDDDDDFSIYLQAKHDADVAVRSTCTGTGLGYTIVRPGGLTDGEPSGSVRVAEHVERGEIPRADVAGVLAELIVTGHGRDRTFEVVSGPTPIDGAIQTLG